MKTSKPSVLFLGKKDDHYTDKALAFCRMVSGEVTAILGDWGDELPDGIEFWKGDYIISFLSRWVVSEKMLGRARVAAINFHPATPAYPGVGCNNFALYEGSSEYGVTCHRMATKVDTGGIIAVERFPVFAEDTVESLLARTYDTQLVLFYKIMGIIGKGEQLPVLYEKWTRKPFTRTELNALERITPDMSREEIQKRVRATTFGNWKPKVEINGFLFELKSQSPR